MCTVGYRLDVFRVHKIALKIIFNGNVFVVYVFIRRISFRFIGCTYKFSSIYKIDRSVFISLDFSWLDVDSGKMDFT